MVQKRHRVKIESKLFLFNKLNINFHMVERQMKMNHMHIAEDEVTVEQIKKGCICI